MFFAISSIDFWVLLVVWLKGFKTSLPAGGEGYVTFAGVRAVSWNGLDNCAKEVCIQMMDLKVIFKVHYVFVWNYFYSS